jgi:hypothetical protein
LLLSHHFPQCLHWLVLWSFNQRSSQCALNLGAGGGGGGRGAGGGGGGLDPPHKLHVFLQFLFTYELLLQYPPRFHLGQSLGLASLQDPAAGGGGGGGGGRGAGGGGDGLDPPHKLHVFLQFFFTYE